jgi:hypothetical protein
VPDERRGRGRDAQLHRVGSGPGPVDLGPVAEATEQLPYPTFRRGLGGECPSLSSLKSQGPSLGVAAVPVCSEPGWAGARRGAACVRGLASDPVTCTGWVALGGIALQVAGVAIALWGVGQTYGIVTDGRMLRRDMFCRRRSETVVGTAAGTLGGLTGLAFGVSRPPEVPRDAPLDEQVAYLRRVAESLTGELDATRRYADDTVARAEKRLAFKMDELSANDDHAAEEMRRMRSAIAGSPAGRGLLTAGRGLAITALGTALTAFALPWG